MGDLAGAERSLRRTLELKPEHALAHRFLGAALLGLGRAGEAAEVLRAGILHAHARGEWKPRNEMLEALSAAGLEPPPLPEAAKSAAMGKEAGTSGFSCRRCGLPNPQIDEPPFPNDLGAEIREQICRPCWREWMAVSIKVINEYRLNLMLPEAQETYDTHLREFLGL
jgi:Fe-S cluster biosynthesis and repair protein YggX